MTNIIRFPSKRPSDFHAEYGRIRWTTSRGPVYLNEASAKQLRDILLNGGNSEAYFDLEDAILELSEPQCAVRSMLEASVREINTQQEA